MNEPDTIKKYEYGCQQNQSIVVLWQQLRGNDLMWSQIVKNIFLKQCGQWLRWEAFKGWDREMDDRILYNRRCTTVGCNGGLSPGQQAVQRAWGNKTLLKLSVNWQDIMLLSRILILHEVYLSYSFSLSFCPPRMIAECLYVSHSTGRDHSENFMYEKISESDKLSYITCTCHLMTNLFIQEVLAWGPLFCLVFLSYSCV